MLQSASIPAAARRSELALVCLGLVAFSCASSAAREAAGAAGEDRSVLEAHQGDIRRLEDMFLRKDAGYTAERDRLLHVEPGIAPWLAKAIVGHAVQARDRLRVAGVVPEQIERRAASNDLLFFRARRELAALGDAGRAAIRVHLLRNTRGELRQLGRYLLAAQPADAVLALYTAELAEGTRASRREAAVGLADLATHDESLVALERAAQDPEWQLRGTAVHALGVAYAKRQDPGHADWFFTVARDDPDPWVRREALLAVGELGDIGQVRRLVDALEQRLAAGGGREAEAAAESLEKLTGRRFGTSVRLWRAWLGSRR